MSGQIKVNTAAVNQTANNIATLNNGIRNDFNSVESEMKALSSVWRGQASERAASAYGSIRYAYLTDRFTVIDNFVNYLRNQIGTGYVQTENDVQNLSDRFR